MFGISAFAQSPFASLAAVKIGAITTADNGNIYLTDFQARGIIGQMLVWGQILNVTDLYWTNIDDDSRFGWSQIDDLKTANWELIAA
jgi:hypothetical protein